MKPSLPLRLVVVSFALVTCLSAAPDYLQVTDFESLQKLAQELARAPYEAPPANLDPFYEGLKYDDHRQILELLSAGKADEVYTLMRGHVTVQGDVLAEYISSGPRPVLYIDYA